MARKNKSRALSVGVIITCIVLLCTLNTSGQSQFQVGYVTYTISGSIEGLGEVEMRGLTDPDGNPVYTDASGYYSTTVQYNWNGIVTPYKEGYTFQPANIPYNKVTQDNIDQNYKPIPITYLITGKTDPNVTLFGFPEETITGPDGMYRATVNWGWSGNVTPYKEGFEFTPSQVDYESVKSNRTQNYESKRIQLEISGSVRYPQVKMTGLPDEVLSDTNGNYSAIVDYGFSGTIRPEKEGHTFEPTELTYSNITISQPNQDYSAIVQQFVIRGNVGIPDVEMQGLDNVYSEADGSYYGIVDYGSDITVIPVKEGWEFLPGSETYSKVTSDKLRDYTPQEQKFTISGRTTVPEVTLIGLPEEVVTGIDGSFSVEVPYNWFGTITPQKEGYDFTPSDKSITPVTQNQPNIIFKADTQMFTIKGNVTIPDVSLRGFPRPVISGVDGSYTADVPYNWNGTVIPYKDGYEFSPEEREYSEVRFSESYHDYTPTLLQRKISGIITTDKAEPAVGIIINASIGGGSTTTDTEGRYELYVDHGWSGTVTPSAEGYIITPSRRNYDQPVIRDMPSQNYTAKQRMFKISHVITMVGTPLAGVTITAKDMDGTIVNTTTTNANGEYTIEVPYNWSGEIIPTKEGLVFNPLSESYYDVMGDWVEGSPVSAVTPTPPDETRVRIDERETTQPPISGAPPQIDTNEPEETTTTGVSTERTALEEQFENLRIQLENLLKDQEEPQEPETIFVSPEEGTLISNSFDDDLIYVLMELNEDSDKPILYEDTLVGSVTRDFENTPLEKVLEMILAPTPYTYIETDDYYLVCEPAVNSSMFPTISETRVIKLNNITSERTIEQIPDFYLPYVKGDMDPNGHAVTVMAPPILAERIEQDIRKIDGTPVHVLLEAKVVVIERGDYLDFGVEWKWPTMSAGVFRNDMYGYGGTGYDFHGKSPWGIQIGYTPDATFTNALEAMLNLLEQNSEATMLSEPSVVALDGELARLGVIREEWFMMTAEQPSNAYGGYYRSELESIESGTILSITPFVGDNNDIKLNMNVEVSDTIAVSSASGLPVITRRTAQNSVFLKSGGTAIVAGLTENRSTKDNRSVPVLSKIPLLGGLFKNKTNDNSTREIAILVTATILSENSTTFNYSTSSVSSSLLPVNQPAGNTMMVNDFQNQLEQALR